MLAIHHMIQELFGYENFKSSAQRRSIEIILESKVKDFIVSMASQGGKSLCYQVPGMLEDQGVTIVISPSLALIYDHKNFLNSKGIKAETINNTTDNKDREKIRNQINKNDSDIRFLFITPEIITMSGIMRNYVELWMTRKKVNYIVVDDAHKIIDAAGSRPAFKQLKDIRAINAEIPWIALTTMTPGFPLAQELGMKNPLIIRSKSMRNNIAYLSAPELTEDSLESFLNNITSEDDPNPSGIFFCESKFVVEETMNLLNYRERRAVEYRSHADQQSNENEQSFEKWKNGDYPFLVTTGEIFGYGINYNVPNIRYVVHVGMPENLRSFYHESSRAGNDGKTGYSMVFGRIEPFLTVQIFQKYHRSHCKKKFLAEFFGETIEKCNFCDACMRNE